MGESIIEATITKWLKKEGDNIQEDESLAEIATDKVDSEIPSPVAGIISKILFKEGDIVPVGTVIAVIEEEGDGTADAGETAEPAPQAKEAKEAKSGITIDPETSKEKAEGSSTIPTRTETAEKSKSAETRSDRFYSPLVKQIAKQENISMEELDAIPGTGMDGRLTKNDLLEYLKTRKQPATAKTRTTAQEVPRQQAPPVQVTGDDQVIEMDRIRQLISAHMVRSVATSAHVSSFVEADMTNAVQWREKNKESFQKKEGIKLTFTPVFIEAIAKTVRDFPMVNVSVDGTKIILHKNINIGMAVALPNENLIVP
ncbi:MAG: dihydrolipoamide acetyltransferase family protein, partial [Syntrophothermus sp.]